MQVTETLNSGLKREIKVVVPASDMEAKLNARLSDAQGKARINGFRPGKVPVNRLRKVYGKSFMAEVVNEILNDSRTIITGRGEKAAMQPEVIMTEDEKEAEKILAGGSDFEFKLNYEVIPAIEIKEFSDIKVERPVYDVPESEIDEQVNRVAESARTYEPKDGKAADRDRVTIDYVGKIDGEAFQGGAGNDQPLVLGSKEFIPGFEDQLVGAKAGDTREVNVSFPTDYPVENLKGKDATFAVSVKGVKTAGETKVDDEFAKSLGLQDIEQLKGLIRGQVEQELNGLTRTHMKRQLLDQLAARHDFPVPESMVEAEHQNILGQLRHEASHEDDPKAALAEIEKDAAEYRNIAERRVRLGLLLSEIGSANGVEVSDQEMNRLIGQAASQYQGKERERFLRLVQQEPMFAAQLRAPLYEDKVVDFLFSKAEVTDRKSTREEIEADLESEEGHVHGPGCGHDHAHGKPKAKTAYAKKEPASKEPIPTKAKAAAKEADVVEKAQAPKPAKPKKSVPANKGATKAVAKAESKPAAKAKKSSKK
jgi:trigger factor